MSHAAFIAQYHPPVVAVDSERPELVYARPGEGRVRTAIGEARRRVHGRRLAYLDSHFPWKRSGFRYADATALHALRPDTVFFSMYEMSDPFPAPVLPLAEFPRLAPVLGITDVYGMFQDFMSGILGLRRETPGEPGPIEGLDLSGALKRERIRAHVGLYPGGGFVPTPTAIALAVRLVDAADTVFSWSPAVLDEVPGVHEIPDAVIDTDFYAAADRDFSARPLELLFVAYAAPRKGLTVALDALRALADAPVHLHVVGPHQHHADRVPDGLATFHGWLGPEQLRALHRRCHVFVSPVSAEVPGALEGDGGVTDGFPTGAAAEAMSSGVLLVTANPDANHRQLRPGVDHVEIPATSEAFADAIRQVLGDPASAHRIAVSGARRIREQMDVRAGAAERLALMGFTPGRTPYRGDVPEALSPRAVAERVGRSLPRRAGPGPELAVLRGELAAARAELQQQLDADRRSMAGTMSEHRALVAELLDHQRELATRLQASIAAAREIGQLVLDDESAVASALGAARSDGDYGRAFTEVDPLVSICIPTYTNHQLLVERSIPSVLAQDHPNLEVVVVGDNAPAETAEAIARLDDPRIRYENLTVRGPYPEDPRRRWLVAGIPALNRSLELARGSWIVIHNDDDALRPRHVSTLLAVAQRLREEVVYGSLLQHAPDGTTETIGGFPPAEGAFGWQLALQHRAMRMFRYKLSASLFGSPGDWDRCRRMLRAGVRFRMVDEIVMDYYPSTLWGSP